MNHNNHNVGSQASATALICSRIAVWRMVHGRENPKGSGRTCDQMGARSVPEALLEQLKPGGRMVIPAPWQRHGAAGIDERT